MVTHDRDLVSTFATRLFAFTENGLVDWQGNYDDFYERFGDAAFSSGRGKPSASAG